jgi:transcriptional regulator with XRE-family HTH domain
MKGPNLGEKLKALRTEYGYKQKDISDFLGVDQSLISKFESGERTISVDLLEKLSSLYCCDLVDNFNTDRPDIRVAFRAKNISAAELQTIQTVNRIVLNSVFMSDLLKEN